MDNDGCSNFVGCIILIVLIATPPIGWIILVILMIVGALDNNSASTSTPSSSSSSNTPVVVAPDDLNNILIDISQGEIRDMISQETFHPGETVYLCLSHRLAYHEDSWQFNNCKCSVCGHRNNTKTYTVPAPVDINQISWEEDVG